MVEFHLHIHSQSLCLSPARPDTSDAADSKLFLAFFLGDCPGITFCSSMQPRLKKETPPPPPPPPPPPAGSQALS
jgi:hypothetical protein